MATAVVLVVSAVVVATVAIVVHAGMTGVATVARVGMIVAESVASPGLSKLVGNHRRRVLLILSIGLATALHSRSFCGGMETFR